MMKGGFCCLRIAFMNALAKPDLLAAIAHFDFHGDFLEIKENHIGHINSTYNLTFKEGDKEHRYIFQRVNANVFPNVKEVMANIVLVLSYMKKKVTDAGGNPDIETMSLVKTKDGGFYYEDPEGNYFRSYYLVEGARTYDQATPEIFGKSGYAFGKFQRDLDGFPAEKLFEVIPHFHDTAKRYNDLEESIAKAPQNRLEIAKNEISWARKNKEISNYLTDKKLPLRVTHNDTKLNNVLFIEKQDATCVIDLDTIMPGLSLYDYGDSIRYGANTCVEDEEDISKIELDLERFEAYTKGYLEGTGTTLTKEEIALFPEAAITLTYECGTRFLKDYLDGDVYFSVSKPMHNLIRAKDQFALVDDMKKKLPQMRAIVERLSA